VFGKDSIGRYKNQIANLAVVIFMVMVSINIYKGQAKNIAALISFSDADAKKNTLLEEIRQSAQRMNSLRDLINNKDVSSVLATLSNVAAETGIKISSLRPGASVDLPLYVKYPFDLAIKAKNYHAIGKFIGQLENNPDIFIIDSLGIALPNQGSDEDQQEGYLSALVRLSTVIFKDK